MAKEEAPAPPPRREGGGGEEGGKRRVTTAWWQLGPVVEEESDGDGRRMCYGDLVLVYLSASEVRQVWLSEGGCVETKFGRFEHDAMVGLEFGSRIESATDGKGWAVALAPTPELWCGSVRHRTQIVQPLDSCMVVAELGLRPGSIVLEAGTGSGACTTALARACGPHGRVYSFEFNADRAEAAREEFASTGLDALVTVQHRDVCEAGFGDVVPADAVFLDLPEPWLAVPKAAAAAAPGARLAAYSPCLEQVQRTKTALLALGCADIRTIEARQRDLDVRLRDHPLPPFLPSPDAQGPPRKRPRLDEAAENNARYENNAPSSPDNQHKKSFLVVKPFPSMRGHTAFLTFATLPDPDSDDSDSEQEPHDQQDHQDPRTSPAPQDDQVVVQDEQPAT